MEYNLVDMGLPSGTLWCDRNLNAEYPEDWGSYYAYGSITARTPEEYGDNYTNLINIDVLQEQNIIDANRNLTDSYDTAAYQTSRALKIPTVEQVEELARNVEVSFDNINEHYCAVLTSNINGNTLIIPASGFCNPYLYDQGISFQYATATAHPLKEYCHSFSVIWGVPSRVLSEKNLVSRFYALPIRPVKCSD